MKEWKHPDPVAWSMLRDEADARARGLCEYCRERPPENLHHRTYVRWGAEQLWDLMYVCRRCHEHIEGIAYAPERFGAEGSLAREGDDGREIDWTWFDYLEKAMYPDGRHRYPEDGPDELDDLDYEIGVRTLCDEADEDFDALYREFGGDLDTIESWARAMDKDD